MDRLLKILQNKYSFYGVLLFNLILLFIPQYYPSMDGPSHLYNSVILKELFTGNTFLEQYYSFNNYFIPNWTSHFLLAMGQFFFPVWLSHKIFLSVYIIGSAVAFRLIIKIITPQNIGLSLLIFPFLYSFLFHLGFYNFCFSLMLFFITVAAWLKTSENFRFVHFISFLLLFTATYYTNVLIFAFLGITIGCLIIVTANKNHTHSLRILPDILSGINSKKLVFDLLKLLMISLPGLYLFVRFYASINFFPSQQAYTLSELLEWIVNLRSLIVYDYAGERLLTIPFFIMLVVLLLSSGICILYSNQIELWKEGCCTNRKHKCLQKFFAKNSYPSDIKTKKGMTKADIFLIPTMLSLILLFATPNGANAGMMSDRYCLLFFVFLLTWLCCRAANSKYNSMIIIVVLIVHFSLQLKHLNASIKPLNRTAQKIIKASSFIKSNAVVLPIRLTDNWLTPHFSNYIGLNHPMVILENYEASVNWFPLKWNRPSFPKITLGNKEKIQGIRWESNPQAKVSKVIDNVLIYGDIKKLEAAKWKELKQVLALFYDLKYQSDDNFILVYSARSKNT